MKIELFLHLASVCLKVHCERPAEMHLAPGEGKPHFKYMGNISRLVSYNQDIPVRNPFPDAFPHYGLAG